MFFIVPERAKQEQQQPSPTLTRGQPASVASSKRRRTDQDDLQQNDQLASNYSKRITRACNRCRLKKARCSGGKVCDRCKQDGVVCVNTTESKKPAQPPRPEYVHLVESQRDQLAQALQKLLPQHDSADSAKLKTLLADMGISTNSLTAAKQLERAQENIVENMTPSTFVEWSGLFDRLHTPQLEAIESLCSDSLLGQDTYGDVSDILLSFSESVPPPNHACNLGEYLTQQSQPDDFWDWSPLTDTVTSNSDAQLQPYNEQQITIDL